VGAATTFWRNALPEIAIERCVLGVELLHPVVPGIDHVDVAECKESAT
jgi:hypothetical protein